MAKDVVDLIMSDHRELERLFELVRTSPDERAMRLPEISALLIAHSRAEEAEVYPAARNEADESDDVEHSQEEHLAAEQMLARVQEMDPYDPGFETALAEFVDAVKHHVEEEESKVLPGIRERLSAERREELAQAFLDARAEHMGAEAGSPTREELDVQAENLGLEGRSSMSKAQLQRAVERHAEL